MRGWSLPGLPRDRRAPGGTGREFGEGLGRDERRGTPHDSGLEDANLSDRRDRSCQMLAESEARGRTLPGLPGNRRIPGVDMAGISERAIDAMNFVERRERAGWSTRPWRSGEIALVRSWWRALPEAGYGDWGDGPSVEELGSEGFLAELDGRPVACAFLHLLPGAGYAAVCAPVCDPTAAPQTCLRGIAMIAEAAADHCRRLGVWEAACFVRTPLIAKGFEMAGWRDGGPKCCHVYLCEETIPWLEP